MLIPYLNDNSVVLDLFAGTGNLGLEAVSRGAERAYFSDESRDSIKLIKENIRICGAEDYCILLSGDYKSNIRRIREKVDIIFIDPPYASNYYLTALHEIAEAGLLRDGGCIVCEHSDRDSMPDEFEGFKLVKDRRYGQIGVSIYE